jgi:rfaE bifunctional protein kinase chain/domain
MKAEALGRARVLVVGDVMLDRYWFGEVSRISPEAPVPVVHVGRAEERLGGAANVALNAASLGARVALLSVAGPDEAGDALARLLAESGMEISLYRDPAYVTTVKLRVIGRQQQLLRVDFETQPGHEVLSAQLEEYRSRLDRCDAVLLSDYGKGGLAHIEAMIALAREAGKPVLVDPKGDDWTLYRGASVITPNRGEFRLVAGSWKTEEQLRDKAEEVRRRFDLQALLLTRSEDGMTLFDADGAHHEPAWVREVYDVTGAGDTVIAALAVGLAAGLSMLEATRLANRAAGVVVGKFGTAVATPEELFEE